jgi:hypothetical protein
MTTNDLYQIALADLSDKTNQFCGRLGVARHTLAGGGLIVCSVSGVAGRSIVARHLRTEFGYRPNGAKYAKKISREQAAALLK